MTYDEKCYDLAESFLSEVPLAGFADERQCEKLAQVIQQAIEDFIEYATDNYDPPEPRLYDNLRDGSFAED